MSGRIKLTPEELQSQAVEMKTLESDFSTLFSGVSSDLKKVNANWSSNLSHNFEGKINSAQKSFDQITEDLMNGANVANACAVTFHSVDTELAKYYSPADAKSKDSYERLLDVFKAGFSDFPEDIESAREVLAWIEQWYEKLPPDFKIIVDIAVPGSLKKAYSFTSDLLQGELSLDSFLDVGKEIAKTSPYVSAVLEAFEYAFATGKVRSDKLGAEFEAQILEGDVLGATFDLTEGLVDIVFGGTIECTFSIAGNLVDAYLKDFPVVGTLINAGSEYITGLATNGENICSIGNLVAGGGEAISAGLDFVTDVITDVTDIATSGITAGVKNVCSWIGSWLD